MASLTVKQQIFDYLADGKPAGIEQIRKALRAKSRNDECAISANLTQLKLDNVVIRCSQCRWQLAPHAKRPMSRLEREAETRRARSFFGQFESVASAAANVLILAPVVRI